jgi:hypothetical protein
VPALRPASETPTVVPEAADRLTLPDAGEVVSHAPPLEVTTEVDQFKALLHAPLALMVAGCVAGLEPPTRPAKVRATGAAAMVQGGETVRVTGIDCGLPVAPVAVIVTVPVYVPGVSPASAAETPIEAVALDATLPDAGATLSHPPLVVACKESVTPPLLLRVIDDWSGVV